MRDALSSVSHVPVITEDAQAESLHATGAFYVRQGFPKQGLALLLAAHKLSIPSIELNRAIAHAYVLAGAPQKALAMLDALAPTLEDDALRRASDRLRARALLAMGKVTEAKAAFAASMERAEPPITSFNVVRGGQ